MTSNYFFVSIELCLDVVNKEHIILCYCGGCIMSGFAINNNHHHHKTFSIIITIIYFLLLLLLLLLLLSLIILFLLLFFLSMLILLIVVFAYPSTMRLQNVASVIIKCDNFITKCDRARSQHCCNVNFILNICCQCYLS